MGSSDLTLRSSNTKHKLISKTNYTSRYKLTLLSKLLTAEFRKQDLNKETPRTSFGALSVWTVTEVTRRTSTQQHAQLVWPLCSLKFKLSNNQLQSSVSGFNIKDVFGVFAADGDRSGLRRGSVGHHFHGQIQQEGD